MGLFLLVFFIILGPVLQTRLGSFGDLSLICAGLLTLWGMTRFQLDRSMSSFLFIVMLLIILGIMNSFLISEIFDYDSLVAILRPLKALIFFMGCFFIFKYSIKNESDVNAKEIYLKLLRCVYWSLVVHGVIIILQFMYPSFRDFTYRVLIDYDVIFYNKSFRMPGLGGAGGAQLGAIQGLGFLIGMHLSLLDKRPYRYYLCNALLIYSIIFTGRTGFILVGIGAAYWLFSFLFKTNLKNKARTLLLLIISLLIAIVSNEKFIEYFENDVYFTVAVKRTFKTYNQYVETGELRDETVDILSDMITIPDKLSVLLIGDGRQYNNTLGAYESDVGYIRLWWAYGIIGLVLMLLFYLQVGYYITRKYVIDVIGKQNVIFGLTLILSILVLNLKEVFFFTRISHPIFIISVMGIYWSVKAQKNLSKPQDIRAV